MCYRLPVRWKLVEEPFIPGAGPNRKLTHTQVGPQDRSPTPSFSQAPLVFAVLWKVWAEFSPVLGELEVIPH